MKNADYLRQNIDNDNIDIFGNKIEEKYEPKAGNIKQVDSKYEISKYFSIEFMFTLIVFESGLIFNRFLL